MEEIAIYRELCRQEKSIPLFSQAWWMDATCGEKGWNVILVRDKEGAVSAAMPYLLKRKWGLRIVCQPQLTQTNGVWFRPSTYKTENERLSAEKRMDDEIIDRIDTLNPSLFIQCFHHSFTNWLPFHWKGFKQTTRYTYRIHDISNLEEVFQNFSDAKKRHIKKAQRNKLSTSDMDAEAFYQFCCEAHAQRGETNLLPKDLVVRCVNAAKRQGNGKVIAVQDEQGNVHSALFLCWDAETTYYLVPATKPEYRTSGASSLLVWEAIREAQKHSNAFDFEGSMEESIENSYRQYGAKQTPYFKITRGWLSWLV